ncbi:potassium transporter [Panus rudis PR-1116 ss-1]|nr:potassium transporter [Panus rudis PR-1116 ss-1]
MEDMKRAPVKVGGLALLSLSFQALGIIYSDLGTSPLYTLNGIWPASGPVPSEEDVIGGISAIVWALTLVPLLKYVFFCLNFGTREGEGGTFALYQGIYPPRQHDEITGRILSDYSIGAESKNTKTTRMSNKFRWPLLIWAFFGTSLTLADGIFTPAVSVTSAVSGIAVAKPSVSSDVIPISIAFLVALFLVQFKGTSAISFVFAPVAFGWLVLLGATGIVNIVSFPGIFRAFDPSRAVLLFVRTKNYDYLAGIVLALTGCEAMFANLGQFNKLSIQLSFSTFVYPCLILAYLGQGARLIVDGEVVLSNIFYQSIPGSSGGPLYWIIFVFAILATLIASQALITATFSLMQQLINMRCFPPLRLKYTSEQYQGQVYVPLANWALMVLTIVVVAAFKSSAQLTNAYGFSVTTVMFTTTTLIAIQIVCVKHLPIVAAVAFFIFFGFIDGLFWGAALKKVPEGAWVPLMIGVILLITMVFWTWARGLEDTFDSTNRRSLRDIIVRKDANDNTTYYVLGDIPNGQDVLDYSPKKSSDEAGTPVSNLTALARIPTCAVFHQLTPGKGVPHSFISFFRQWPALPRVVVFLSARVLPVARVALEDRYYVSKARNLEGFYSVIYYLGFRDDFNVEASILATSISLREMRSASSEASSRLAEIQQAARNFTHIVPHYVVSSRERQDGRLSAIWDWARKLLIDEVYMRIAIMFPETSNWQGTPDRVIHVGISAAI